MPEDAQLNLLPCPYCGSENVEVGEGPYVRCSDCGATGPRDDSNNYDDVANAIAAWNKGPYADRFEIHAKALKDHAAALRAKADEHTKKAEELLRKAEGVGR